MENNDINPKVSVIIPNYNHASFLDERIESVVNQTYQDFEVIILDDCSKDNSKEIIEKYRKNPKIKHIVFNEENSGSTFIQWNKGFNLSKGEYIWIAESDDVAHINFLEHIMKEMTQDKDIVLGFSDLTAIDRVGNRLHGYTRKTYAKNKIMLGDDFIKKNMIFGNHIINASCAVFRKDILEDVPKDYTKLKSAGDYLFWIEVAKKGKIVKIPEILNFYRQHNTKVTSNAEKSGIMYIETNQIFRRLIELGCIGNQFSALACIGFWLQRINLSRGRFESENTYQQVSNLWKSSSKYSSFSQIAFYITGALRRIKRQVMGYYV